MVPEMNLTTPERMLSDIRLCLTRIVDVLVQDDFTVGADVQLRSIEKLDGDRTVAVAERFVGKGVFTPDDRAELLAYRGDRPGQRRA